MEVSWLRELGLKQINLLCEGGREHTLQSLASSLKCLLLMMCVIIFTKVLFDHMLNYTMKGILHIFNLRQIESLV